jgi:hypothetical protein
MLHLVTQELIELCDKFTAVEVTFLSLSLSPFI